MLIAVPALAQLSPGDLAKPHAFLEGLRNCTKCHEIGGGPTQAKCLTCHLEIEQVLQAKRGFHFEAVQSRGQTCSECHSDHNGKKFELIHWPEGKDAFDHKQTGFPLLGKHEKVECEKCHRPDNIAFDLHALNKDIDLDKTFLGLGQRCASCHADEHRGQLSQDCEKCHQVSGWKPASGFDHDKARFRLSGRHVRVACAKCHPAVRARNKPSDPALRKTFTKFVDISFANCSACHSDPHRGSFGANCKRCHSTLDWKKIGASSFDHSVTRFPLLGLHNSVSCEKCHKPNQPRRGLQFARCTDCHADKHDGQFADRKDGSRCESCHDVSGFSPANFDVAEHNQTRYPLTGAHLAVPCYQCHFQEFSGNGSRQKFDFSNTSCDACHDDAHAGQFAVKVRLGGCISCHQTESWQKTNFDHSTARFPLQGKHAGVPCRQCHKLAPLGAGIEGLLFRPMDMTCKGCHQDLHLAQFEQEPEVKTCGQCHQPLGWTQLLFRHNRDSRYRLRGAHRQVACLKCHPVENQEMAEFIRFRPLDSRCISCHKEDGTSR